MLAWADILVASACVLNCLPRPQSSYVPLQSKSPDELATGTKPDLSKHIAAPGQLVAHHVDGVKSSSCKQTANLGYFVKPSGGGWLVRDVKSWRLYVSHNVRVVSCSTNGVAAQAVAVSHALNSEALRGDIGLVSASARDVASSVHALASSGLLWAEPPVNAVALLDPITGLAVRLSYVNIDGSIALMPDDIFDEPSATKTDTAPLAPPLSSAATAPQKPRWFQTMGSSPGQRHLIVFQQLSREAWCQRDTLRGLSRFAHGG
jgi:hypothetical protein